MAVNDQVIFENHCKEVLGSNFKAVWSKAVETYKQTLDESLSKGTSKATSENNAFRAANLIMLAALKEIGEEEWRPKKKGDDGVKKSTQRATGKPTSSGVVNNNPLPKGVKGIQLDW